MRGPAAAGRHVAIAVTAAVAGAGMLLAQAPRPVRLELKTASRHPIQFYVSLPEGWTAGKAWPVVVVIEGADREFERAGTVFVDARRQLPFILVVPLVVTNGGARVRDVPTYHYADAVWDRIEREGGCRFDADGVGAAVADVHRLYGGEDKYFLTGFEAGGHTVWAFIFQHPETLRAAALAGPNYAGRCEGFSADGSRAGLPVRGFQGANDPSWTPPGPMYTQWQRAREVARAHGYEHVDETVVSGAGHGPFAAEVLAYFGSLLEPSPAR